MSGAVIPPPLDADGFARLMAPFAPFESSPDLAVAVSGGRDSLALALLAHDWARTRGGSIVALIVDHGLRVEAADEATATSDRLALFGIEGTVLRWSGAKPRTGLQEAARAARYRLLRAECQRRGILHLLVAHHADDQAETVAMRAARQSGADGLAGMAALVEFPEVRMLRPLLPVSRAELTATLVSRGVQWIDDPSNVDPRFERARLRLNPSYSSPVIGGGARSNGAEGEGRRQDAYEPDVGTRETAIVAFPLRPCGPVPPMTGKQRAAREHALAQAAVHAIEFDETGQPAIDWSGFQRLDPAARSRLLSRLVQRVGGRDHPPRRDRLERAAERLVAPTARGGSGRSQDFTLAQCRLMLRQAPSSRRLRWLVRAEKPRNSGQPLVPAAFFACGAAATAHLE
ncbi:MAG: tRNA lysidine(34) synthetase TilS [Reyranellaceae bacterium]